MPTENGPRMLADTLQTSCHSWKSPRKSTANSAAASTTGSISHMRGCSRRLKLASTNQRPVALAERDRIVRNITFIPIEKIC